MVEFGLKLDDNKVAEWGDSYINYERLKLFIKKAKELRESKEDLINRHPEKAAFLMTSYEKDGISLSKNESDTRTRIFSERDFTNLNKKGHGNEKEYEIACTSLGKREMQHLDERKSLLEEVSIPLKYDSYTVDPEVCITKRDTPLFRSYSESSLASLVKNVTGLFQGSSYETQLIEAFAAETTILHSFSTCLEQEFEKVNLFYIKKLDELEKRLDLLADNAGASFYESGKTNHKIPRHDHEQLQGKLRESDSIKRALIDLHRRAKLLQNYTIMNQTGFIKIIKKFYKSYPDRKGQFDQMTVENICQGGITVNDTANKMEIFFADLFCQGILTEARAKMLPKKGDGLEMDWSQLRLGYRLGMCSVLAVWVCWDCVWGLLVNGDSTIGGRAAFPVFRGCGGLLLLHWCWGVSVSVWTRYRINYIFLFDFNPRSVDSPLMIFEDATDETLVYFILMLLYYKSGANDIPNIIPTGFYPLILVLYTIKCSIFPWRTMGPMWRAVGAIVLSPLTAPSFFQVYTADVFTSMIKIFQDIVWTCCFFFSGDFLILEVEKDGTSSHKEWQKTFWYNSILIPLVCLLPLWIRFNQCLRRYISTKKRLPNLANAFKYAMSQTVTLFGTFHPLYLMHHHDNYNKRSFSILVEKDDIFQIFWMGLFVTSSIYSFAWDIYFDWGLGRPQYALLGPRLMFPSKLSYYLVALVDLFLRFMWVLTLVPPQSGAKFEIPNYLTAVTMNLELLRRTMWGFFRLEHEHRHNTEGFRKFEFVPLHFNTGHEHKYKKQEERIGWSVLGEVAMVTAVVVSISVASVIAAQKATSISEKLTQGVD